MTIQLAIIIELLLIAALIIVWLKDNNLFKKIQMQIIDLQDELDSFREKRSLEIAAAIKKFKRTKPVVAQAPVKKTVAKKKKK